MKFITRLILFVQYVLAAYKRTFGSEKPTPSDADQSTAEASDREAWEKAKAEHERQMRESDSEFWKEEK